MTEQEKLINVDLYGDGSRGFAQSTFIAIMPMCARYTRKENASVKRHYLAFVVNLAA